MSYDEGHGRQISQGVKVQISGYLAIILAFFSLFGGSVGSTPSNMKHGGSIRVEIRPSLPLDPLKIQTMADYDLALCLYRTWFDYDAARMAIPGLVHEWSFDNSTGTYRFVVSKNARWSDGSPILAKHLIANLNRAVKLKTAYGDAVTAIMNLASARILDDKAFELQTMDHRPSEAFFQRMGSIFLALVHPGDIGVDHKIRKNSLFSGAYKIVSLYQFLQN